MLESWGVSRYTDLWGKDGKVVRAAAKVTTSTKTNHAFDCLEKTLNFRKEDMKRHARNRRCRGVCAESATCTDCDTRRKHEFIHNLLVESKEGLATIV